MIGIDTLCIEIIARCPLRCVHCSANAAPERSELLSRSAFAEILAELGHAEAVFISGGEPFEHPDILGMISDARRITSNVVVYSSGVRIDEGHRSLSNSEVIAASEAGVRRVDFSLYASTAELHDEVTTLPGSFDLTVGSAARFAQAGVPFGFHFVPIADNGTEISEVMKLAVRMGAERVHVLAPVPQGRGRLVDCAMRPQTLSEIAHLRLRGFPVELVLSSEIRQALGMADPASRDLLSPAFLDVHGYLYPGEGERRPGTRSKSSYLAGATLNQLLGEIDAGHRVAVAG